ncbi:hypothetical protein L9F63_021754, partial [Diploptera punctata]
MYYKDLILYFSGNDSDVVENLQSSRLIKQCGRCPTCRIPQVLHKNKQYKLNYCIFCRRCKKHTSLIQGTFLEQLHINLMTKLEIIYLWSKNISVVQYFSYCRDISSWKLSTDQG